MGLFGLFKRKEARVELPSEERPSIRKASARPQVRCRECDGYYVLRNGQYGFFAGCSNYPKCRAKLKIQELFAQYLKEYGVKVYAWKKTCYRCHKQTTVYSYYLGYQLQEAYAEYCWEMMGIGDIPYLDALIAERHPMIKLCSSKTAQATYMANTCEHCGAMQGKNFVVDDPHEILDELYMEHTMEQYFIETLPVEATTEFQNQMKQFINA